MNKKSLLFSLVATLGLALSCVDESTYPLPYNDRETGAYMRVVKLNSNVFDLNDLPNSALDGVFEIVDEEYGDLLESFEIVVSIRRGINFSKDVALTSIPSTEFEAVPQPTYSKYKRARIKITADEALTALQTSDGLYKLSPNGKETIFVSAFDGVYAAGDVVNFRGIVNLKDGRSFTNSNTNINILSGQFYNSTFVYPVTVRAQPANTWTGNFSLTQSAIWSPNHSAALHATAFPTYLAQRLFPDQTVTISKPADGLSTEREFQVQYRGVTTTLRFNLEPGSSTTGTVFVPLQYSGVDCTPERQIFWCMPVSGTFAGTAAVAARSPLLPGASTSNRGSYTVAQGGTAGNVITIGLDDDCDEYGRRNGYCTWTRRVRLTLTKL